MIKGIIIGFFCFLLFLSHIFIFHKFNIKRHFFAMIKVFFFGIVLYTVLFSISKGSQIQRCVTSFMPVALVAFLNGSFLHFFFCYFYLHLIQVIDRSPSTRIMVEIERSPQKRLTLGEIKELYSIDRKISNELEDMVIMERLNKEATFYAITPKGKMHLRIFKFIRDYLRLRRN